MEKNKPGFMVYKATVETMQTLTGEQCKTLMLAIGEFAFQEVEPDFADDKTLTSLWPLLRDGLRRDDKRYKTVNTGKQYSAYCGAAKRNGLVPMSREKWEEAGCPTYRETQATRANAGNAEQTQATRANAGNAEQTQATRANAGGCSQMLTGAGICAQREPTTITNASTSSLTIPSSPPAPLSTSDGEAAVAAEDAGFLKVMKEMRKLIPQLSPLREDLLKQYCSTVGADVCVMAIYEAMDANLEGAANWYYVDKVLTRCKESGICSLEAWNASEAQRRTQKTGHRGSEPQPKQGKDRVPAPEDYQGESNFHLRRK